MGKEKNIRSILLYTISYVIFLLSLIVILKPRIISNIRDNGYIEAIKEYRKILLEGESAEQEVALYSIEGIEFATAESKIGFTDVDHLRIEALLESPSEDNLRDGLVSYIDDGTRLIGLTIDDDIAYITLSKDSLSSLDFNKAKRQIEETLRIGRENLRVAIIVDDEII